MVAYGTYRNLSVDVSDGIARIRINRPDKHNALDTATMLDFQRAFDQIRLDRSVDVVVIEGRGEEAFSAGADIEQYAGPATAHDPVQRDRQTLFYRIYRAPRDIHPVVIAKIDGYCIGGGLILASYCDLRIATTQASFGVPTADIGQIPTGGSTYRLARLVGDAKARELVFTAGRIDGREARRIGLVNDVVEPDDLEETVAETVAGIQDTGRLAVKNSKRALNRAAEHRDLDTARETEAEIWWEQFATDERRRLVDSFLEE